MIRTMAASRWSGLRRRRDPGQNQDQNQNPL